MKNCILIVVLAVLGACSSSPEANSQEPEMESVSEQVTDIETVPETSEQTESKEESAVESTIDTIAVEPDQSEAPKDSIHATDPRVQRILDEKMIKSKMDSLEQHNSKK